MMSPSHDQPSDTLLARFLEGDLSEQEARRIEGSLKNSPDVRRRAEQLQQIRGALSAAPACLANIDVAGSVLAAAKIPQAERARRQGSSRLVSALAWASAAAACMLLGLRPEHERNNVRPEFVEKAALGPGAHSKVRVSFQVHRVGVDGRARPTTIGFDKNDGLLFGYTNVGPGSYQHLMLFGVDAEKRVLWFYPAYEQAGTDPVSTPISDNAVESLLPDVVRHDYAPGPLTVYALFTREPLHVSQVESCLRRQILTSDCPVADSLLYSRGFEVKP